MTNPGNGAQSPRRFRVLPGSSVAVRTTFILAFAGGISWVAFAFKAVENIRPNTNEFDYYPSSGAVVYPPSSAWAWWTIGVGCLAAVLLLSGAAMLVMRMLASRTFIVIGCAVVTAYNIFSIVAAFSRQSQPVQNALPLRFELSAVIVVFAAVTVVFAFAPSTRRWLEISQQRGQNSDADDS
jgi:hypothetical protein